MKTKESSGGLQLKKSVLPGAIIFGLLASIIIYVVLINSEKNALADYEKGTIYIAADEIPEGTLISVENIPSFFKLEELDKDLIPKAAISTPEQIEDLISRYTIEKGTLLTRGMFESVNEVTEGMEEPVIAGFKADDLYQVVGGTLRAGDRIHIYSVDEEGEVLLIWSNVCVQEVFDSSGVKITNDDEHTSAQRINVYMDKKDVEPFYSELAKGSLRVVLVSD